MLDKEKVIAKQLDFFFGDQELKLIIDEEFKKSMLKRVNGLFARYNELEEVFWELRESVEKLKKTVYTP